MKKLYMPLALISLLCTVPQLYSADTGSVENKLRAAIVGKQIQRVRAFLAYIDLDDIQNPAQLLTDAIDSPNILKMLLEKGIDANTSLVPPITPTALHLAVVFGNKEAVEVLLAFGANPTATNEQEKTPEDLTTNQEIIDILNASSIFVKFPAKS